MELSFVLLENYEILLKPKGDEIIVSLDNLEEYLELTMSRVFPKEADQKAKWIRQGISDLVDVSIVSKLIKPSEMDLFICGNSSDHKNWDKDVLAKHIENDGLKKEVF